MSLLNIKENSINKDDNGIERYFGTEQERYSFDLNGTGDYLTVIKDENDLWIVEDDTMSNHIHFTEAIDITIDGYIDEYDELEGKENVVEELKTLLKSVQREQMKREQFI